MTDLLEELGNRPGSESRPGSATSVLRTVFGISARARGRWLPVSALISLLGAVDVAGPRARTALNRVKTKGMLRAETHDGHAGYALTDEGVAVLTAGDRRVMHPRFMSSPTDPWCLISFSVPEKNRDLRYQLRRRLAWIGCGNVSPALWICPGFLVDEVEDIVKDLDLVGRATIFMTDEIRGATSARQTAATWWNLDGIAGLYTDFLARHAAAIAECGPDPEPRTAFRTWTLALDTWRPIPYLDPGLPPSFLPDDWPGVRSVELFTDLRNAAVDPAARYVRSVVAAALYGDDPSDDPSGGGDPAEMSGASGAAA